MKKKGERAQNELSTISEVEQIKKLKKHLADSDEEEEKPKREFKDWSKEEQEIFLEEQRVKSRKILAERAALEEYEERIAKETIRTFKDAPDEIKIVRVRKVTNCSAEIEWDVPESNGAAITTYRVYMSSTTLRDVGTVNFKQLDHRHVFEKVQET